MDHTNATDGSKVHGAGVSTIYRPHQAGHLPEVRSSLPQMSKISGAWHGYCRTLWLLRRARRPAIDLIWGMNRQMKDIYKNGQKTQKKT